MKISIEATEKIVDFDGVPCRLWEGITESGLPCKVLVRGIGVANHVHQEEFDQELQEQLPPGVWVSFRQIIYLSGAWIRTGGAATAAG